MLLQTVFLLSALLQPTPQPTALDLARDLERLQQTARVLFVAAHPDDENTQLLGYLANHRGWRAAYLSLTRGEGGQNAIGDELDHGLGLIRTWELLTARSVDGAEQWIGPQRDFGYSKSAEEALDVWGDGAALSDVVWIVRRFRPDVIVTRFPEEGSTHGHHLASARLARRAFELAGDPTAFPEQLSGADAVEPWRPTRLLYDVPLRWMGGEILDEWYTVDLGAYDSLLGRSYGELAAQSRSMHRSQAFGSAARRGPDIEAFALLAGSEPADEDPFADIPTGWATRPGGAALASALADAEATFDARDPAASIPALLAAHGAAAELEYDADRTEARARIEAWIVAAAGLFVDARVEHATAAPGDEIAVTLHVLARADAGWNVTEATVPGAPSIGATAALGVGEPWSRTVTAIVPADAPVSTPYWLVEPPGTGRYGVPDRTLVGQPIGPPALTATVTLRRGDGPAFAVEVPVRAVNVDSILGERVAPLTVLPPLVLAPAAPVVLLRNGEPGEVSVTVEATTTVDDAVVQVQVPEGWSVAPRERPVSLQAGERAPLAFVVSAPDGALPADLRVVARVGERVDGWTRRTIDYPHLPPLTMLTPATVRATPLEWTVPAGPVGYVMGAGDAVAGALVAAGVDVRLLDDATLESGDLSVYRTILVGPRAFHERAPLRTHTQRLWDYAAAGGVVIVQYQTNNWSQALDIDVGPAPITIGRGRVTVETAPMSWTDAGRAVRDGLHTLGDADFDDWVQERGLYFAETWDPAWTPLLSATDPGEAPQLGALLLARHGEGGVFYTGLAFFRQLPAGVPGAYRVLANLIAWEPEP